MQSAQQLSILLAHVRELREAGVNVDSMLGPDFEGAGRGPRHEMRSQIRSQFAQQLDEHIKHYEIFEDQIGDLTIRYATADGQTTPLLSAAMSSRFIDASHAVLGHPATHLRLDNPGHRLMIDKLTQDLDASVRVIDASLRPALADVKASSAIQIYTQHVDSLSPEAPSSIDSYS